MTAQTASPPITAEATPRPWKQDAWYVVGEVDGGRPGGEIIIGCLPTRAYGIEYTEPQRRANAALIVYAVNRLPLYEAAVEALKRLINVGDALWEDHPPVWMTEADQARSALARLTEGNHRDPR